MKENLDIWLTTLIVIIFALVFESLLFTSSIPKQSDCMWITTQTYICKAS